MSGSELRLPNNKKGKRTLEKLIKPAQDRKIEEETDIPGAAEMIRKLEKQITKLSKRVKMLEAQNEKLWADYQRRRMAGGGN